MTMHVVTGNLLMAANNIATDNTDEALKAFQELSIDEQLAWLWFVYGKMGSSITPAAPGAASSEISDGLFNQVKEQSKDEQLASMRAIARRDQSSRISREYGSLSDNTKLAFWYALAVGMDEGSIVGMPKDYGLSDNGQQLLATVETMDFESQITILRNAVEPMGAEPKAGSAI